MWQHSNISYYHCIIINALQVEGSIWKILSIIQRKTIWETEPKAASQFALGYSGKSIRK